MARIDRVLRPSWKSPKKYQLHSVQNKKFYNSKAWKDLRGEKLDVNPFCEECEKKGLLVDAYYVDHIKPINEGGALLPPLNELMSLCITCDARKRGIESRRKIKGRGVRIL